ncbi:Golgin candidate [Arachis hypogaea]|nr:Golgin candidate [Arachis hypogaea]
MASWLKAAEDLFEHVDRRAKLVVSDLAEEQPDSKPPASNGQGSKGNRTKKSRLSTPATVTSDATAEKSEILAAAVDATTQRDNVELVAENDRSTPISADQPNKEQPVDSTSPLSDTSLSQKPTDDVGKHATDDVKILAAETVSEVATVSTNGEPVKENAYEEDPPQTSKGIEAPSDELTNVGQTNKPRDLDANQNVNQERSESVGADIIPNNDDGPKDGDVKNESVPNRKNDQHHKTEISPQKVQDQLEEAQGLLKTTKSTGGSKEARLARVCAGLSTRLQEYKSENAQLEELLTAERELSKSYEANIKQLQKDLSESKREVTRVESNMVEALAAKNAEIEALLSSMDALKRQAAQSEGNLASIQVNMESMMRNRELTETRMMQALREELASAERRAEEERAAHNATKMAAMEREVDLEQRAIESSTALARIQRIADERTAKATELEQKVALLEVECSSLNQELQDMEARLRREQKKSPEEANQVIQMQARQEELERARQGQREAENKLSSLEAEFQKMRVEMAAMKRDAEHYSRQEHMELEKRYRELTDLLYYKQTQLETMVSEKAATEFQLEKEIKRLQEAQAEAERSRVSRRASTSWEDETEIKSLEALPVHHRHLVGASIQLQKAVKLLDSGAVRATRFLWRYPTARVILFFYLVFVHLFLMYLLHRLQEQDALSAREVAESMGLSTQNLH